ncbi:MAG: AAA-like domain-containing protein [Anaerolineae bacterium]|nr:AAA-like domain-containing protein [Anaerolineae bacterium]
MHELSPDLRHRIRAALLRCGAFDSDDVVRSLFLDARLSLWRNDVPAAPTPNRRVDALLDALRERRNDSDDPAYVLLLRVLAEQCPVGDACRQELSALAGEVERALKGAIFISYKRHAEPDERLAVALSVALTARGYRVFLDQMMRTGETWMKTLDMQIQQADLLVVLLSMTSADSEMVQYEVSRAAEYRRLQQDHPRILPVRLNYEDLLPYTLAPFLNPLQYALWRADTDTAPLLDDIIAAMQDRLPPCEPVMPSVAAQLSEDGRPLQDTTRLQPPLPAFDPRYLRTMPAPGGKLRLSDKFYVEREADVLLKNQVVGQGTVTTIRASRQTGKSSLLARGMAHANLEGLPVVSLDFQQVDAESLMPYERFLHYLAEVIALELDLDCDVLAQIWNGPLGPQDRLTRWMQREVLAELDRPLLLALDEADRLLSFPYHDDFFALLRAWYNKAANVLVWENLNLVLVISTEPHLLIRDLSQSPFNVGLPLYLEDFTEAQVRDLNLRHGAPLAESEISDFLHWLGGHPYLTRQAFYSLITRQWHWEDLLLHATEPHGPFSSHLRNYYSLLCDVVDIRAALREVHNRRVCGNEVMFTRLLRAGLLKGYSGTACDYRCELYRRYFDDKL